MGHRQLAFVFAVLTTAIMLGYTVLRLELHITPLVNIISLITISVGSSFALLFVARKKWELGYLNALGMLAGSSVLFALLFAGICVFAYDYFPSSGTIIKPSFGALVAVNLSMRIPVDAIVAIFWKRKA